ncbi:MAG: methyltransferase domain-containing protein [Myxococcota bacterium]
MRPPALDHLVCPGCHAHLQLSVESEQQAHVMEGVLHCEHCAKAYPIRKGVPRFIPAQLEPDTARTVKRFGEQWARFRELDDFYEAQFVAWIHPNSPDSFREEVVLEAGCGKGRHSRLVASWGAKAVFAMDLGSSVEVAFENTQDLPNVHVVQADLRSLPFRSSAFDTAFSVGVLHHIEDPEAAFQCLVEALKPGGRVIAWVYGRENNGWIIRGINPIRQRVTSRLPFRWVYELSKVPAAVLYGMGRGVYRPLCRGRLAPLGRRLFYQAYINQIAEFPFSEVHNIVHDHLTPPIAHYIAGETFRSWFTNRGLTDIRIGWHNENSWRGTARRPRSAET